MTRERRRERARRVRRACVEQLLQAAAIGRLERQLRAQLGAQLGVEPCARELLVRLPRKKRTAQPAAEGCIGRMRAGQPQARRARRRSPARRRARGLRSSTVARHVPPSSAAANRSISCLAPRGRRRRRRRRARTGSPRDVASPMRTPRAARRRRRRAWPRDSVPAGGRRRCLFDRRAARGKVRQQGRSRAGYGSSRSATTSLAARGDAAPSTPLRAPLGRSSRCRRATRDRRDTNRAERGSRLDSPSLVAQPDRSASGAVQPKRRPPTRRRRHGRSARCSRRTPRRRGATARTTDSP